MSTVSAARIETFLNIVPYFFGSAELLIDSVGDDFKMSCPIREGGTEKKNLDDHGPKIYQFLRPPLFNYFVVSDWIYIFLSRSEISAGWRDEAKRHHMQQLSPIIVPTSFRKCEARLVLIHDGENM